MVRKSQESLIPTEKSEKFCLCVQTSVKAVDVGIFLPAPATRGLAKFSRLSGCPGLMWSP